MDGEIPFDIDDILRNIDDAEVISIYLPRMRKTILVDTRFTSENPPMIKVVTMALSIDERSRVLRRLRPRFAKPNAITVIPWHKYVESLVHSGVWQKILERIVESGHRAIVQECSQVLQEVYLLEMDEFHAVINGENYYTMWARS